jgi:hypothetical protein
MRVVALDARHRRHVRTKVLCGEILVRIVAHQTKVRHRSGELEGLFAAVGVVAGRAILGGSSMGAVPFDQRLDVTVTCETQFGTSRPEQVFLGRHVRLMTLDTAPVPHRSVHRALAKFCFQVGVAGKTEPGALDDQAELCAAGSSVTTFTRTIRKGRMNLRTYKHRGRLGPVRLMAVGTTRPTDRQIVSFVDLGRLVADKADFASSDREQMILGRSMGLMTAETRVHHRGVRRR